MLIVLQNQKGFLDRVLDLLDSLIMLFSKVMPAWANVVLIIIMCFIIVILLFAHLQKDKENVTDQASNITINVSGASAIKNQDENFLNNNRTIEIPHVEKRESPQIYRQKLQNIRDIAEGDEKLTIS